MKKIGDKYTSNAFENIKHIDDYGNEFWYARELSKVFFYREGKKYYFKFNNNKYECNSITINKLKEQLILPYKIEFLGLSKAQLGRVLSNLLDSTTDIKFQRQKNEKDNILRFEAIFYEKKRIIDIYKMQNYSCLYGRSKNCNPYILTNISNKVILLEVTKDYIKTNGAEYYFLASDLTSSEKEFFDSCYMQINCDFVYNLNNNGRFKKINCIKKS